MCAPVGNEGAYHVGCLGYLGLLVRLTGFAIVYDGFTFSAGDVRSLCRYQYPQSSFSYGRTHLADLTIQHRKGPK